MIGLMMNLLKLATSAVKAVPITTAMASSMTLPRIRKSLKPLITGISVGDGRRQRRRGPRASANITAAHCQKGMSVTNQANRIATAPVAAAPVTRLATALGTDRTTSLFVGSALDGGGM